MRRFVSGVVAVAALFAAGCGAEEPPAPVAAPPAPAGPARLPIGEITQADVPALMEAIYPEGAPPTVRDLGLFVIGERVGLLTGADNAEACADCAGSVSLFYLIRTEAGFELQADYPDFHASGSGGTLSPDLEFVRLGGLDGRPVHASLIDVKRVESAGCSARTLNVHIFTEAGPRAALEAPFGYAKGSDRVNAELVKPEPYQAELAIAYTSRSDEFVTPYLFMGQSLRSTFPVPGWTRTTC